MDAVDSDPLQNAFTAQGWHFGVQKRCLQKMSTQIQHFTADVTQLTAQQTISTRPAPTARVQHLESWPNKFVGDPAQCRGFLLSCSLYFIEQEGVSDQHQRGWRVGNSLQHYLWPLQIYDHVIWTLLCPLGVPMLYQLCAKKYVG